MTAASTTDWVLFAGMLLTSLVGYYKTGSVKIALVLFVVSPVLLLGIITAGAVVLVPLVLIVGGIIVTAYAVSS